MKVLIFDTETGGTNVDVNTVLQLSYQILDTRTWRKEKVVNHFFDYPDDLSRVEQGAIDVNGITPEFLSQQTISEQRDAYEEFVEDVEYVDLIVGHNMAFDVLFCREECDYYGIPYAKNDWTKCFDTMLSTVYMTKIPKAPRTDGYVPKCPFKYPKLSELGDFLQIDKSDIRLHDSAEDVELTARCFRKLWERGYVKYYLDKYGYSRLRFDRR